MPEFDLVVVTCDKYEQPETTNPYIENVLLEDRLVQEAFEAMGLRVIRKSWSTKNFDWSNTKAALIRTTWDYFDRYEEWQNWLEKVSSVTRLINPIELIRWNMDKHYLGDLQKKGVNIPETLYIETGSKATLQALHSQTAWTETILKPCVSGAARHTYKLNPENIEAHEIIFQQLTSKEAFMLQPFQKNVVSKGEISLMVMGGQFTHAVLKIAKPGDFRVQDDFGGTVHNYSPSKEEMAFAEKAVAACHPHPYYARVDIIRDNNDQLAVIELEMIEPELWFRLKPKAANELASAVFGG